MRVLAHAHSTWSYDGTLTLPEWAAIAATRGCGAVLLAEHEESGWNAARYREYADACAILSLDGVRLIPGMEFTQDGFHLLAYGLEHLPSRPGSIAQLAEEVRAQGSRLCLAHPSKYRRPCPDDMLAHLDGVEVWNSKWIYDGLVGPHRRSLALAAGKTHLVGQDAHKRKHLAPLYLVTETADVLADLWAGRYLITLGEHRWPATELPRDAWTALRHGCRSAAVRAVLACCRVLRV